MTTRSIIRPSKTVAIVVPMHNRKELTPDEEISFRHLVHFLGKYDKFLVIPKNLDMDRLGFRVKRFDDSFFGSSTANTKLMLSPAFYEAFADYEYILIYHPDALVFSDQLLEWCDTGLDYIGAPWVKCDDTPGVTVERVGNGGLSLRKIESFLKVIYSDKYEIEPNEYWRQFCASKPKYVQCLNLPRKYLKRLKAFNGVQWQMSRWHLEENDRRNEDYFWSDEAVKYYPGFKVASFQTGLRFAFEVAPRFCFELTHHTLPFGCHAWPRYDRSFWEPYLIT